MRPGCLLRSTRTACAAGAITLAVGTLTLLVHLLLMQSLWSNRIEMVISYWNADLGWAHNQTDFNYSICGHGTIAKPPLSPLCTVPINKGAEASAYLLYILNNWDRLPRWIAFLDDKQESWHQHFDKIARLRCVQRLIDQREATPFMAINGVRIDTDEAWRGFKPELWGKLWDSIVFPHLHTRIPQRLVGDGSAQFVVSRDRIWARPKALYEDLYKYAIGTRRWPGDNTWVDAHGNFIGPGGPPDTFAGGTFFLEWIWHYLLGQPAVDESGVPPKCREK